MLSLAIASMLLLETPKLVVLKDKGMPSFDPYSLTSATGVPDSLTLKQVNELAKGFVDKPKAKLVVSLSGGELAPSSKGDMEVIDAKSVSPDGIRFSGDTASSNYAWAIVRLPKLKMGARYVVVFKAKATPGAGLYFTTAKDSGRLTLPKEYANVPVAFTAQKDQDWFRFQSANPQGPNAAKFYIIEVNAIEVYSLE